MCVKALSHPYLPHVGAPGRPRQCAFALRARRGCARYARGGLGGRDAVRGHLARQRGDGRGRVGGGTD